MVATSTHPAPPTLHRSRATRAQSVLVVESRALVAWGIKVLLSDQPWVQRCVVADSGAAAIQHARDDHPDVALIGSDVQGVQGTTLAASVRALDPAMVLLLLCDTRLPAETLIRQAGAAGAISKELPLQEFVGAVHAAAAGHWVGRRGPTVDHGLSEREQVILELIAGGATNKEIGLALHLSPHTVKGGTMALYRKLGVRNRAEAVARAQRLGIAA